MTTYTFIDVDGVLTHDAMYVSPHVKKNIKSIEERWPFDPNCVKVLNKLCVETNAKIVISSSWRVGRTLKFLQKLFKDRGVIADVIDVTPKTKMNGTRGEEIHAWIKNNADVENDNFIVVDDETIDILHIERYFKEGQMRIISVVGGWYAGGLKEEHLE